jgi:hypothetical protein
MQSRLAAHKMNFVPARPDVKTEASLADVLKGATIFRRPCGANRKRLVERWIREVLRAQ